MSWIWIVLLALGVGIVAAAEWPLVRGSVGGDARRKRARDKRKAEWTVLRTEDDEFAESVQRDLDSLPTTEEPRSKR